MNNKDKYNEVTARFYDVVYDKLLNETGLNFYLNEIRNTKGRILEAGVGTGRIFVPAIDEGADIHGLDFSDTMINVLKGKLDSNDHKRIHYGDIRDFELKEKFDLIISPFRVFQHMLTTEDQLNALESIYRHLNDGGRLIFDVFVPNIKRMSRERKGVKEFDGEYSPGKKLMRFADIENDYINQLLDVTFKYVWDENGEMKEGEHAVKLRYYFRFELINLIGRSKFMLEKIYGDFNFGELSNESNDFVVICRK